jgi:hypothetical protein
MLIILALAHAGLLSTALKPSGYKIDPVDLHEIHVRDDFWAPRLVTNAKVTLYHELDALDSTGRIDNFRAAAGDPGYVYKGLVFDDSDVYKVIEAIGDSLQLYPDPAIESRVDAIVDIIGKAQEPDGYLHTPQQCRARGQETPVRTAEHWINEDWDHELYCAGHMYEGATAYYLATGKRKFLDIAIKNANLVCSHFNAQVDKSVSGHEEVEIGLVKLYRVTGDHKYLDEAKWLIDQRGRPEGRRRLNGDYAQDDRPVTDQPHAEGHAVRAAYLYSGMSDVAALDDLQPYKAALDRFWNDVAGSQIYVTGGIGSTGSNEGFSSLYNLPNQTAYCETCASAANALWCERMFEGSGEGKYVDVAERTMYNAFLSGVGLDGKSFFYPNVLTSVHGARRSPWFECACCPPNVARLLPEFAGWIYSKAPKTLYVNYFVASDLDTTINGVPVKVSMDTKYPWDGHIVLRVNPERPVKFKLAVRVPGWTQGDPIEGKLYTFSSTADVNAASFKLDKAAKTSMGDDTDGYRSTERTWRKGDEVTIDLKMPVERVLADDRVKDDRGRVAIQRGPLVYCAEFKDQPTHHTLDVMLPGDTQFTEQFQPELLGGVETLSTEAPTVSRNLAGQPVESEDKTHLTLIPYADWANRGRGAMTVWFATQPDKATPAPAPTLARTAHLTTSGGTNPDAMTDQHVPASSIDETSPFFHWWPKKGTHEWVQLDLAKPSEISSVRVYWFQDQGIGECRIPKAWRVLVKKDGAWMPVTGASSYEIAKDRWCSVRFDKIEATAVKIEVDLPDGFSTGIQQLELK